MDITTRGIVSRNIALRDVFMGKQKETRLTATNIDDRIMCLLSALKTKEADLIYEWKGWDEDRANLLFQWFHIDLMEALKRREDKGIQMCIERILGWGGIIDKENKNGEKTSERFAQQLKKQKKTSMSLYDIAYLDEDNLPLSSWSKVLAAYAPDDYWIYDSRVAIALRFIDPNPIAHSFNNMSTVWFTPSQKNTNKNTKTLADAIGQKSGDSVQSYCNYCRLMKDVRRNGGDPGHCEKKLFMLGGHLSEMYKNQETVLLNLKRFKDMEEINKKHYPAPHQKHKVFVSGQAIREACLTVLRPTVHGSETSRTQKTHPCFKPTWTA